MKPFLYLLSGVLAAPGALFACYLWSVAATIREGIRINNLWKTLIHLFMWAVEAAVWAMYLLPFFVALWVVLAFLPKYRVIGAAITSLVAVASMIEFFIILGPVKPGELFLPALSLAGLLISSWLIWNSIRG